MEGLVNIIRFRFHLDPYHLDPYDRNTLFLFCGKRTDRIKGLLWEGDGFLLLYKRLDNGAFNWPRNNEEVLSITPDQYAIGSADVMERVSLPGKAKRWQLDGKGTESFGTLPEKVEYNTQHEYLTESRENEDVAYLAQLKKEYGLD